MTDLQNLIERARSWSPRTHPAPIASAYEIVRALAALPIDIEHKTRAIIIEQQKREIAELREHLDQAMRLKRLSAQAYQLVKKRAEKAERDFEAQRDWGWEQKNRADEFRDGLGAALKRESAAIERAEKAEAKSAPDSDRIRDLKQRAEIEKKAREKAESERDELRDALGCDPDSDAVSLAKTLQAMADASGKAQEENAELREQLKKAEANNGVAMLRRLRDKFAMPSFGYGDYYKGVDEQRVGFINAINAMIAEAEKPAEPYGRLGDPRAVSLNPEGAKILSETVIEQPLTPEQEDAIVRRVRKEVAGTNREMGPANPVPDPEPKDREGDDERAPIEPDQLGYSIALQRAIEHHCRGVKVPDEAMGSAVRSRCLHHAEMLDAALEKPAPTDAEREREIEEWKDRATSACTPPPNADPDGPYAIGHPVQCPRCKAEEPAEPLTPEQEDAIVRYVRREVAGTDREMGPANPVPDPDPEPKDREGDDVLQRWLNKARKGDGFVDLQGDAVAELCRRALGEER